MAGQAAIWNGALARVVAVHGMTEEDPVLAQAVSTALVESVALSTRRSYNTGAKSWMRFCMLRDLQPWPVDRMWFCGWMVEMASSIKVQSLKVYMAGVRYHQQLEGLSWGLTNDQIVVRVLRYLKRRIPSRDKAPKVPVTVGLLRKILVLLPGWPNLAEMSLDDRVFATASMIGTTGFLRGGEFLSSPGSVRPTLKAGMLKVRELSYGRAVVVSVRQPKARWWLHTVEVPIFENKDDPEWCPVRVWEEYVAGAARGWIDGPAFVRGDGSVVDRGFMTARTSELMGRAGVSFVSSTGERMSVKMASWRSGGVRSAVDAGLSEEMIRLLGRWRSSAWRNYLLHSSADMQGAARSLWGTRLRVQQVPAELRVAEGDVGGCFVRSQALVDEEMKEVEQLLVGREGLRQASGSERRELRGRLVGLRRAEG